MSYNGKGLIVYYKVFCCQIITTPDHQVHIKHHVDAWCVAFKVINIEWKISWLSAPWGLDSGRSGPFFVTYMNILTGLYNGYKLQELVTSHKMHVDCTWKLIQTLWNPGQQSHGSKFPTRSPHAYFRVPYISSQMNSSSTVHFCMCVWRLHAAHVAMVHNIILMKLIWICWPNARFHSETK